MGSKVPHIIVFIFLVSVLSNKTFASETYVPDRPVLEEVISGYAFQSSEIQALQDDDFANPGLLWRDQGKKLFSTSVNDQPSCAECHSEGQTSKTQSLTPLTLRGAATRYPQYNDETKKLINIEQRINRCRQNYQKQSPWIYESEDLLSITTYVAGLSNGMPFDVQVEGKAKQFFEEGRRYYYTRIGQLNLACNHCHENNYGKRLRGDILSQGQSNNYPTYRLDWQKQGSLHRRLRFCNFGVRAEPLEYGSDTYVNLELFLAWRAVGLLFEVPSVRR